MSARNTDNKGFSKYSRQVFSRHHIAPTAFLNFTLSLGDCTATLYILFDALLHKLGGEMHSEFDGSLYQIIYHFSNLFISVKFNRFRLNFYYRYIFSFQVLSLKPSYTMQAWSTFTKQTQSVT